VKEGRATPHLKGVEQVGCGRERGSCECQTRKSYESDAKASVRSSDAVWCRNPPVPFGVRRHGAICFVGTPQRSFGYVFGAPPCI